MLNYLDANLPFIMKEGGIDLLRVIISLLNNDCQQAARCLANISLDSKFSYELMLPNTVSLLSSLMTTSNKDTQLQLLRCLANLTSNGNNTPGGADLSRQN